MSSKEELDEVENDIHLQTSPATNQLHTNQKNTHNVETGILNSLGAHSPAVASDIGSTNNDNDLGFNPNLIEQYRASNMGSYSG